MRKKKKGKAKGGTLCFKRVICPEFGDRLGRGGDATPALASTRAHLTRLLVFLNLPCDPEMFDKWIIDGRVDGVLLLAAGVLRVF